MDKTHKDFLQCRWEKALANNCVSRFLVVLLVQFQSSCYFLRRFVVTFACFLFFRRSLLFNLSLYAAPQNSFFYSFLLILSHTPRPFLARLRAAPLLSAKSVARVQKGMAERKKITATARNFGIKLEKKKSFPRPWSFLFVLTWLAVLTSSWSFAICSVKT